jgi:hypothetical protein
VIEHLLCKSKALSSDPSSTKEKKNLIMMNHVCVCVYVCVCIYPVWYSLRFLDSDGLLSSINFRKVLGWYWSLNSGPCYLLGKYTTT